MTTFDLDFTVLDEPVPMPRPRSGTGHARPFTPTRALEAQRRIREEAMKHLPADWQPFTGPIAMHVVVFLLPAKSMPKRLREARTAHVVKRPDVNNLVSTVMDALSKYVYRDDSQVWLIRAEKVYAWEGSPRWEIRLRG